MERFCNIRATEHAAPRGCALLLRGLLSDASNKWIFILKKRGRGEGEGGRSKGKGREKGERQKQRRKGSEGKRRGKKKRVKVKRKRKEYQEKGKERKGKERKGEEKERKERKRKEEKKKKRKRSDQNGRDHWRKWTNEPRNEVPFRCISFVLPFARLSLASRHRTSAQRSRSQHSCGTDRVFHTPREARKNGHFPNLFFLAPITAEY